MTFSVRKSFIVVTALSMLGIVNLRVFDFFIVFFVGCLFFFYKFRKKSIFYFVLVLLAFSFITVFPREGFEYTQFYWLIYLVRAFFVFMVFQYIFDPEKDLDLLLKSGLLGAFIVFAAAALQILGIQVGENPVVAWNFRLSGFGNSNYLAVSLIFFVFLWIFKYSTSGKGSFFYPSFLLSLFLWSGSRGAILGFSVAIISCFFLVCYRALTSGKIPRPYKVLVGVGVSVFFLISAFVYSFFSVFRDFLRLADLQEVTGSGRDMLWIEAIDLFHGSGFLIKILGHGGGAAWTLNYSKDSFKAVHNDYITILIDYGLLGLVFFVAFNLFLLFKAARSGFDFLPFYPIFLVIFMMTNDVSNGAPYAASLSICFVLSRLKNNQIQALKYNL